MISVDTNILVRIFVDDSKQKTQVELARKLVKKSKQIFITQVVLIEMIWVLMRAYRLNKKQILLLLEHLLDNRAFEIQSRDSFREALELFKTNNADFSDCMILVESKKYESNELFTFDKKLSKISGVKLLK